MGGFETGSGDDPFAETDEEEGKPPEKSAEPEVRDDIEEAVSSAGSKVSVPKTTVGENDSDSANLGLAGISPGDGETISPNEVARRLAPPDYRQDSASQQVPVTTWRGTVNTGRTERKMFELQEQLLDLEDEAVSVVGSELDAEPKKTDLREFALAWAYSNPEILVEMAEEWGLQFD